MNNIILFENKSDCCGCGACCNACPKNAISMQEDENGFFYPVIDHSSCVKCGICKNVCAYQANMLDANEPKAAYAAVSTDKGLVEVSASGGIFAELAKSFLSLNGYVCGCSMEMKQDKLFPEHIVINSESDLFKLQGSKYAQSYIGSIFTEVKKLLSAGEKVLFSGTPCQVAALYSFLGEKYLDNLYTIDVICHGVPNIKFFNDYCECLRKKLKAEKITGFRFRDKTAGWGLKAKVVYKDRNSRPKSRRIPCQLSSYYMLFLDGDLYRENCYSCKYACGERVGDLTIGDYWGIEKEHPECLSVNGGKIDAASGASCILVNSNKGEELLKRTSQKFIMTESSYEKIARHNGQLVRPTEKSNKRDKIFEIWRNGGYGAVDNWYYKSLGNKRYIYLLWNKMPVKIQLLVKKMKMKNRDNI